MYNPNQPPIQYAANHPAPTPNGSSTMPPPSLTPPQTQPAPPVHHPGAVPQQQYPTGQPVSVPQHQPGPAPLPTPALDASFQQPSGLMTVQVHAYPTPLPTPAYTPDPNNPHTAGHPPEKVEKIQQMLQNMPPEQLLQLQQQFAQPQEQPQPQPQPQYSQPQQQQYGQPPQPRQLHFAPPPMQPLNNTPQGFTPTLKDDQKSGKVKRFMGDTLFGRVARASVQTATSAVKMPLALSPWGDNNPVTLPNVRYRDAILFTTFAAFGADAFVSEVVSMGTGTIVGSTVLKYGVFQIVEQAIDKGILEKLLPEEEKMLATTDVKSLQVGIKHKLMGVDADIRFGGVTPTRDEKACEKGWFCPYLFASARTPLVPRKNDFAMAQCFGPFLAGDYALAHKLLSESLTVLPFCDPDPKNDTGGNRILLLFTAISPFRGNMWSSSRRPGCGTIVFHLFSGIPSLVLPANPTAPICAWSPWTLAQIRGGQGRGYVPEMHHEQVCEWLDTIVDQHRLSAPVQKRYIEVLSRAVSLVVNGALALQSAPPACLAKVDPDRAGIVAFRY
ncbi:hypothetical protein P152DRAFT_430225 [Eremomyces bilateralis CBS 781.70]|uniref:Uncharacterized protein n=1 Tax=Eremomyces bilateralis CBS 781.70 TaxID=1392243 RepID=A0A6G1GCN4_9PEZI|nr:uncharacterized protein P152DRAFT_430225 [Eremomyces bilateralis CBS 781.70]KAF1815855.1 hypothetical protein P152DRAFT_430225 [Eremomyces bilateralis CBS 781.70]